VVYSDELNHASIIDGCRLSGAAVHVYRHCDVGHLRQLLSDRGRSPEDLLPEPTKRAPARTERRSGDAGRRLIVTDSLFSMHGDFAPLMDIATLASEFGAMVMADEAHATGVFGARGRGLCEQQGVEPMVPVRMGTLSKALGGHGGFVAGSQHLIDWLANRARPYVYSTAEPAAVAAAGLAALSIDLAPLRAVLLNRARQLREGLASRGLIPDSPTSQIVPVILGAPHRAMAAAQALRTKGFFVPGIRPPSVPDGQSLLRISVTASHTPEDIDCLVAAIHEVAR
jgi:8-amino-7-oxononanoate synthase